MTTSNICECGHEEAEHHSVTKECFGIIGYPDENGEVEYCPCKKFKPKLAGEKLI